VKSSIIILFIRRQVYILILSFILKLLLVSIHVVSRTVIVLFSILVLLLLAIHLLLHLIWVAIFRHLVLILLFVVIHIIKKLNIYKKVSLFDLLKLKFIIVNL